MNTELTGQLGEEASGGRCAKGTQELAGRSNWLPPGMEGQRQRGVEASPYLTRERTSGHIDCSPSCRWSRDELASDLMPPGGFLGEAGKRKPNWGTCSILLGRSKAKAH